VAQGSQQAGAEQNGPMTEGCVFCDHDRLREADLCLENGFCIYSSTRDPRDPPDVMPGSGAIVPKAHRASPFDLTAGEWAATRELLILVRAELHRRLAPDGYTLGWNDQTGLHPHLHVIPRFDDEPMAGHGVRTGIKDPANRRPDPWRPGTGRHAPVSGPGQRWTPR
jgi:diadenosine tetraphosphate (Ap4A) HIT family hydrolase